MSYLEEFAHLAQEEKPSPFFRLWEEYCMADTVDGEELVKVLSIIKNSSMAVPFGQIAESTLNLWQKIEQQKVKDDVLALILDLQTTNSPLLADLATDYLKKNFGKQPDFHEKMRLVGLRGRHAFQKAISNYLLLSHMGKGKFVYHTAGWGVGEVIDFSLLQEHVLLEFEGVPALKDLSLENAFKTLFPLSSDHFLSRRFGDPDTLEKEGKENPVSLVRMLLKDLGPKTAQEIKEELCVLVIPEEDWTKWWQGARSKLKKDTLIASPKSVREPFILREEEMPHSVRLHEMMQKTREIDALILLVYNFLRDFPEVLKNEDLRGQLKERLMEGLEADEEFPELSLARKLQACFLLEDIFSEEFPGAAKSLIASLENLEGVVNLIEILAFKKRTLVTARECREDWRETFLHLLFVVSQNQIRDYLFKELYGDEQARAPLQQKLEELLHRMTLYVEPFFWYFQKVVAGEDVPLNDKEHLHKFLEAFLIALHYVESQPDTRDTVKKMYQMLTAKRYAVVRQLIEGGSVEFLQEFLLLASKCHSFSKQDHRILRSLAEVVQPSLSSKKKLRETFETVWTTQEGYQKAQEHLQKLGTVETIENAKEIEEARAHGDLRENSEYKFALEKRSRIQGEMKVLSDQLNRARILTHEDIHPTEVGPGAIVELKEESGNRVAYTLLGPWDANPDQHILSFQSKFAEAMMGKKAGERFEFQNQAYSIVGIKSFLDS